MDKPLIIMVDDDHIILNMYAAVMRRFFEVKVFASVVEALAYTHQNAEEICAVIVDIMMPYEGVFTRTDTDDGLETGICLYNQLRETFDAIPIIILTQVSTEKVEARITPSENVRILEKQDARPSEVAKILQELIVPRNRRS